MSEADRESLARLCRGPRDWFILPESVSKSAARRMVKLGWIWIRDVAIDSPEGRRKLFRVRVTSSGYAANQSSNEPEREASGAQGSRLKAQGRAPSEARS